MPLADEIPQFPGMPTGLRRAAINHASGRLKGWHSLAMGRRRDKARQTSTRPNEPITAYAHKWFPGTKRQHGLVAIKVWYEERRQKVHLPITLPQSVRETLGAANSEHQRIYAEMACIKETERQTAQICPHCQHQHRQVGLGVKHTFSGSNDRLLGCAWSHVQTTAMLPMLTWSA